MDTYYIFTEAYESGKSLGCIFEQSFEEMMQSQAYLDSLDRQDAAAARMCTGCPYDGYCNHEPLANGHREEFGERCAIGFPLHQKIEEMLSARGISAEYLSSQTSPDVPNLRFLTN